MTGAPPHIAAMPEEIDPPRRAASIWRRIAVVGLVVAAVGLPINHLFGYGLLLIAVMLVFAGTVTAQIWRWLAAIAAVGAVVALQALFPPPRIEEGHNVFLIDPQNG